MLARKLLAHHNDALWAESNNVEHCLHNIDPESMYLHGMLQLLHRWGKATDHAIDYRGQSIMSGCR